MEVTHHISPKRSHVVLLVGTTKGAFLFSSTPARGDAQRKCKGGDGGVAVSELKLIKRCAEIRSIDEIRNVPNGIRGIYVLLIQQPKSGKSNKKGTSDYNVVYVGMARGKGAGIKGRLRSHASAESKKGLWTHFSVFEVRDRISERDIAELEGLFRHIYRRDGRANLMNRRYVFGKLTEIRVNDWSKWK